MSGNGPKQILFSRLAEVAKAVAHPLRLEILEQLAQGERSVELLAKRVHASVANTSQHLQHMRRAGLAVARRDGKFILYRLADDIVLDLVAAMRRIAERDQNEAEQLVQRYFRDRDSLEPVSRPDLMRRLDAGIVTVLDVRPEDEFALGHVPGAVNIPIDLLAQRLAELDPGQEIIAYCRGPYCVLAFEAVAALRAHGFKARRLEDGLPEWRAAGLPVEMGPSGSQVAA